MLTLQVRAAGGDYPVFIGSGSLRRLPKLIRECGAPAALHLVSDSRVYPRYGRRVERELGRLRIPLSRTVLPAGERTKSVTALDRIWREAARAGLDRRGWIVALGGGVVGDLAGFAAATLFRGIRLLQVPTTLLAMVDSSVGGKTGINLSEGKNLVGAFHQPQGVIIDLELLRSLPAREWSCGWAEIIKAAAIRDARLFRHLEKHAGALRKRSSALLEGVVHAACRIKAEVVEADERESGLRMVLNFGHTFGHGLEAAAGYRGLLHGEAVALGMSFITRLGSALGWASSSAGVRIRSLLERFGLPTSVPPRFAAPPSRVLGAMGRDKKKGPEGLRWVLVPRIGSSEVRSDIPWRSVELAVEQFLREGTEKG